LSQENNPNLGHQYATENIVNTRFLSWSKLVFRSSTSRSYFTESSKKGEKAE